MRSFFGNSVKNVSLRLALMATLGAFIFAVQPGSWANGGGYITNTVMQGSGTVTAGIGSGVLGTTHSIVLTSTLTGINPGQAVSYYLIITSPEGSGINLNDSSTVSTASMNIFCPSPVNDFACTPQNANKSFTLAAASSGGNATVPVTFNFTPPVAGTYILTFNTIAPQGVTVTNPLVTYTYTAVGPPHRLLIMAQPSGAVSRSAFTTQPAVIMVDSESATVTSFTGNVTVTKVSGSGTLSGTTTVAAVAGVATFTDLVITGSGPHILSFAPANGVTPATTSSLFNVAGPTVSTRITLEDPDTRTVSTGSGTNNTEFTFIIRQTFENLQVPDSATVSITLTPPQGVTSMTRTETCLATSITCQSQFSALGSTNILSAPSRINTEEVYIAYTFTPTVAGIYAFQIATTSSNIQVNNPLVTYTYTAIGPPARSLIVTQPSGAVSGSAFTTQPVVRIVDSESATVTSFTGNVTVIKALGSGTLSGTTTVAAVAGVATFTDLVITGSGPHLLSFAPANGVTPAVTSNSFNVSDHTTGSSGGGVPITSTFNPTYQVVYNSNAIDLVSTIYDFNNYFTGQKAIIVSQIPTRPGYTFVAWNTSVSGNGTSYRSGDSIFVASSNVILHAIWRMNQYILSFDLNYGPTRQIDYGPQDFNSLVKLPAIPLDLLRTGYNFVGWNEKADGSGASYTAGGTYRIGAANITLFAQWKINQYTIYYDANGNIRGRVPALVRRNYGSIVEVNAPSRIFTRKGHTFVGWNSEKDGSGKNYQVGETIALGAENLILYANWQPRTFLVKFLNNSKEYLPSPQFVADGVISSAPTPKDRSGYVFKGWSSKPGKGELIGFPFKPNVLRNITLFAVWERTK